MIGHTIDDLSRLGDVTARDILDYLFKKDAAGPLQREFAKDTRNLISKVPGVNNRAAVHVGRFAGRALPVLSAAANVGDVADLIAGDDGLGNKIVDAGAMALGGTAGFLLGGGPLGASVGASTGKAVADGIQGLFFKNPEEEKLAKALALLEKGVI